MNLPPSISDHLYDISFAAPFPPPPLMQRVSTLTSEADFASHGRDIFHALSQAAPAPLLTFESILDFGTGCGRLARMFKGFSGRYVGADVDHEAVDWVGQQLPWVTAIRTTPRLPLPLGTGNFACAISVSVFTHINEADTRFYLSELHRVTKPEAILLLTIHGERALKRAEAEPSILAMLGISSASLGECRHHVNAGQMRFVSQPELATPEYDYGVTFTSEAFIRKRWSEFYTVKHIWPGAIHDFQDIVVLTRA